MNVWKSLLDMFGFSGWNCLKDYKKIEEGDIITLLNIRLR